MEDKEQKIKISFETNADETGKKIEGVNKSIDKATTETESLGKAQTNAKKSTSDLGKGLEGLGGPIGGAVSGFKAMLKQMWLIVANPIGLILTAIVGALALLFKAFTSTKGGAEKFEQIMAGLGAIIDVIRDRILKAVDAIGKFLTGDFKGAIEAGKEAVSGFGDEVAKEFKKAADATKSLQEVEDAFRSLGVTRAKLNRDLAESERILTDTNSTYLEKKKALEEVEKAEAKQTNAELANAKKKLKAIQDQNALSDSSAEALDKEAEAQIRVFELEQKSAEDRRKVSEFNKTLQNEEQARLKTISDERKARIKEQIALERERIKAIEELKKEGFNAEKNLQRAVEDLEDDTEEKKLERQKQRAIEEIEALKQKGIDVENITRLNEDRFMILEAELFDKRTKEREERQKIEDAKILEEQRKKAEEEKAIDEALLRQKEEIKQKTADIASQGVGLLANIFGKSKKVQKAAMIAEGAISIGKQIAANNAANIGALATPQAIATSGASAVPVIALNNVSTGIGVASTIASTAKALKSLGGGGGGLSADSSSRGGGAGGSATPQVSFQASSENQIANATASNLSQQPIEAFIVESSVSSAQQLANNRITSNSL